MPLDPKANRILDMMSAAAAVAPASNGIAERREAFRKLMLMAKAPLASGHVEELTLPGPGGPLAARLYVPEDAAKITAGLVFFHGGGLVAGSLDTHDSLCRTLAATAGCRVVSVAYRLAPEHRFPAAVEDACAASAWIAGNAAAFGINAYRIAVGGDSAGGTLAAVVCQWARRTPTLRIAAQLLLCPALDFAGTYPSRRTLAQGYLVEEATVQRDVGLYLDGATSFDDPRVSPLRAGDLSGLPCALIHTAEFDPLRDEGAAYARRLIRAGVRARHTCHPGMIHHFYCLGGVLPYAQAVLKEIGAELDKELSG